MISNIDFLPISKYSWKSTRKNIRERVKWVSLIFIKIDFKVFLDINPEEYKRVTDFEYWFFAHFYILENQLWRGWVDWVSLIFIKIDFKVFLNINPEEYMRVTDFSWFTILIDWSFQVKFVATSLIWNEKHLSISLQGEGSYRQHLTEQAGIGQDF